ncbi:MAG TPA: MFS transporter [Acidimicrobiia bacterium]
MAGESSTDADPDPGTGESRSLVHHRDFVHLWSAETVSQVGTQVSMLAIPLMAIKVLHASTFQVGALTAVEFAPFLIVGLPAGAIVDRVRRRPVMMICDLGRAASLASLPIVHAFGALSMWQLYVVVFANGVMTVFFDVANMSILPSLVDRDQIADGNAKLEVSRSGAQVAGPGLAGLLVQWIGSVTAVLVDAVSFVGSAVFLSFIRTAEPPVEKHPPGMRPRLRTEIREGMAYVWHHTMLRPIAFCTATSNLFSSMISAVYIVYAVRELHYAAGTIGLTFVFGGAGAVIGALVCARVTRPFGVGPTIVWSIFVSGIGMLLVGLAPRSSAFAWFVVGWALFSFTGVVYNVNQGSLRQVITAPRLQGRMNASMRFMVWGTMPFGALIGGALGTAIGLRPTLVVAGIGGMLAGFWVLCSPVRTLREMSDGPTTSGVEDTLVH